MNKDYIKWFWDYCCYSHASWGKKKLFNCTIAKILLQCKLQFSVSLYNYNFKKDIALSEKKAILLQSRNIFQVKTYFYERVRIWNWGETQ